MKRVLAVVLLLFAVPLLWGQTVPNPRPIAVALTETSATLSWAAVSGATSYSFWRQQADGTYGQLWEKFLTITEPTYTFSGLAPGTRGVYGITSNNNGGPQIPGTLVSFRTLLKPVWYGNIPSSFDQGALYQAFLNFDGEPQPIVTILEGPPTMFLGWAYGGAQDKMLYWNGASDRPVYVNLRAESSFGVADLGITLNPSNATPIIPARVSKRILTSVGGGKVRAVVQGFRPYLGRVRLYVKRPGATVYSRVSLANMVFVNGGYEQAVSSAGTFQVSASVTSKAVVWSNPVSIK